ncbi:hypothetical protein [Acididesulfobacillus acetoxydans]|nr:hypothetical protein [Acididesulfobacillus acetoxydans]
MSRISWWILDITTIEKKKQALVFSCQQAAEQMIKQGSGRKIIDIAHQ